MRLVALVGTFGCHAVLDGSLPGAPVGEATPVATTPCAGPWSVDAMPPSCWRPFADEAAFNTPLPAQPRIWEHSASIIERLLGDQAPAHRVGNLAFPEAGDSGWPTYYATADDPVYRAHCVYSDAPWSWGACTIEGMAFHLPAGAVRQGGCGASDGDGGPNTGADRHLTVFDQTQGKVLSFWHVKQCPLPPPGSTLDVGFGGWAAMAGNGTQVETATAWGTGTAAGFSNALGTIRFEELRDGAIHHALAIKINWEGKVWDDALGELVWHSFPARADGRRICPWASGATCAPSFLPPNETSGNPWNVAPMGTRLWLDIPVATIESYAWMNREQKTILEALASYGGVMNDTGAEGIFDLQLEGGMEYTALGAADPWFPWAESAAAQQPAQQIGWERWNGNMLLHLYNQYSGTYGPAWWIANVWSHLRVVDPCVSNRTCDSANAAQLCIPGTRRCGECGTDYSRLSSTDASPAQHACVYSCDASGSAWVLGADCGNHYGACTSNETGAAWCGH